MFYFLPVSCFFIIIWHLMVKHLHKKNTGFNKTNIHSINKAMWHKLPMHCKNFTKTLEQILLYYYDSCRATSSPNTWGLTQSEYKEKKKAQCHWSLPIIQCLFKFVYVCQASPNQPRCTGACSLEFQKH